MAILNGFLHPICIVLSQSCFTEHCCSNIKPELFYRALLFLNIKPGLFYRALLFLNIKPGLFYRALLFLNIKPGLFYRALLLNINPGLFYRALLLNIKPELFYRGVLFLIVSNLIFFICCSQVAKDASIPAMVTHFQKLFDVAELSGVFPKMNEVYTSLSKYKNVVRSIQEALQIGTYCMSI